MFTQLRSTRLLPYAALFTIAAIILAACANQPAAQVNTSNSGANSAQTAPSTVAAEANTATVAPTGTTASTVAPTVTAADTATVAPTAGSDPAASTSQVSFTKDIMPILQNSCVSCHGGEKTSKGLDLKTFASTMTGSQFGAVVVPGDAAKSKLIQSVQSGKMPKRGDKLTPAQIQLLMDWVNAGATNN